MEIAVQAQALLVGDLIVDEDACGYSSVKRLQWGLEPTSPLSVYVEGEEGDIIRKFDPFERVRIMRNSHVRRQ